MIPLITIHQKGNFKNAESFFSNVLERLYIKKLEKYGQMGVEALKEATPKRTGKTSESWSYSIKEDSKGFSIVWDNSNVSGGAKVAILIQNGHGTPSGYYVQGIDYINPALEPIFKKIGEEAWMEVTKNAYYR